MKGDILGGTEVPIAGGSNIFAPIPFLIFPHGGENSSLTRIYTATNGRLGRDSDERDVRGERAAVVGFMKRN